MSYSDSIKNLIRQADSDCEISRQMALGVIEVQYKQLESALASSREECGRLREALEYAKRFLKSEDVDMDFIEQSLAETPDDKDKT